jgi:glutamate 5-kinase
VAQAGAANGVLLLSDIDGLYDRDPKLPGATRIPLVRRLTSAIHAMASAGSTSGLGSGGMTSKLQAAEIAGHAGIALGIIDGQPVAPIGQALAVGAGTLFVPKARKTARKAWLGGRLRLKGALTVDAGAARALGKGSSLLAAGVIAIEGTFVRGDAVAVCDAGGMVLAHGLSEYDAGECEAIRGRHSREHADILGYAPRNAMIHRDQLVLL